MTVLRKTKHLHVLGQLISYIYIYIFSILNTVNGYIDVQFHVKGDLSGYTKEYIRDVIDTVAAILECNEEDILLNGVRPSTSFLLTLSVKEVYSWKLLVLNEEDRKKFWRLNIDYLIIDKNTIDLEGLKGKQYNFVFSVFNYCFLFESFTLYRFADMFSSFRFLLI